jgi:predicted dehydrogenase
MGSTAPNTLRVGVVGCGFWSRFQIQAWSEVDGVRVVALHSLHRSDAEAAQALAPGAELFERVEDLAAQVDLVDIIASVPAHRPLVETLLPLGVPVVCQKPLGATIEEC